MNICGSVTLSVKSPEVSVVTWSVCDQVLPFESFVKTERLSPAGHPEPVTVTTEPGA